MASTPPLQPVAPQGLAEGEISIFKQLEIPETFGNLDEAYRVFERLFASLEAGEITFEQFAQVPKPDYESFDELQWHVLRMIQPKTRAHHYLLSEETFLGLTERQGFAYIADFMGQRQLVELMYKTITTKVGEDAVRMNDVFVVLVYRLGLETCVSLMAELAILAVEFEAPQGFGSIFFRREGEVKKYYESFEVILNGFPEYSKGSLAKIYQSKYKGKRLQEIADNSQFAEIKTLCVSKDFIESADKDFPKAKALAPSLTSNAIINFIEFASSYFNPTIVPANDPAIHELTDVVNNISTPSVLTELVTYLFDKYRDKSEGEDAKKYYGALLARAASKLKSMLKGTNLVRVYLSSLLLGPDARLGSIFDEEVKRRKEEFLAMLINGNIDPTLVEVVLSLSHTEKNWFYQALKSHLLSDRINTLPLHKPLAKSFIVLMKNLNPNEGGKLLKKHLLSLPDFESNFNGYIAFVAEVLLSADYSHESVAKLIQSIKEDLTTRKNQRAEQVRLAEERRQVEIARQQEFERQRLLAAIQAPSSYSEGPELITLSDFERARLNNEEFSQIIHDSLTLHPELSALSRLSSGLNGLSGSFEEQLITLSTDESRFEAATSSPEQIILIDESSLISQFGVTALRFTYEGGSFHLAAIFGNRPQIGEHQRFINGISINEDAEFTSPAEVFAAYPWVQPLFNAELLRLFLEFHDLGSADFDLNTIRILLGLEKYIPPASLPRPEPILDPVPAPDAVDSKESSETQNTRDFLGENYDRFSDLYLDLAEAYGEGIEYDFTDIASAIAGLQSSITTSKEISPIGARVEVAARHKFKKFIDYIDFYNVRTTAKVLEDLKIRPELAHENLEDSHLVRVQAKLASGQEISVNACIIPPEYKVYILGVSSGDYLDQQDKVFVMLQHLILESFYKAVAMEYPTENHSTPHKHGSGEGKWELNMQRVITDVSKGAYPVLVMVPLNKSQPNADPDSPEGTLDNDMGNIPLPRSRSEKVQAMFWEIAGALGSQESALASWGVYLAAPDYLAARTSYVRDEFPQDSWCDGGATLHERYSEILMPLRTAADVYEIFEVLAQKRQYNLDPGKSVEDIVDSLMADLELGDDPAQLFSSLFPATNLSPEDPNFPFQLRARTLFHARTDEIANYEQLYNAVYERAKLRFTQLQMDPKSITPEKIYRAFLTMSTLDSRKVNLALTGASSYRFDYRRNTNGANTPAESIFNAQDYEVPPHTSLDVVKIIAGNRARIAENVDLWLKGKNRTPEFNFAATNQSPHHNPKLGPAVNLEPRKRALLVWEFEDGDFAFTYLDDARDKRSKSGLTTGEETLFASRKVAEAIDFATTENATGEFSDFNDAANFKSPELARLQELGVIKVTGRGKRARITWSKPIKRKKVVIFQQEQIGYRQPKADVGLQEYFKFLHANGCPIPANIPFDPELAEIQNAFHDVLSS